MATYRIQTAYKDTDGNLKMTEKVFEAETKADAALKAEEYFTRQFSFCDRNEFLFSTPKKIDSTSSRSVSIGGSASGATIVTGQGNTVVQHGRTNINLGSLDGVHIGDTYY